MTRVALVLSEPLGTWAAQLRPRLDSRPVRFFEARSAAEFDAAIAGVACPVVVIDLGGDPIDGLGRLDRVVRQSPAARVLVLDPLSVDGVGDLARELGATHVISGFVPPPDVAALIDRWIALAVAQTEREGWTRPIPAETPLDAESWLEAVLRA